MSVENLIEPDSFTFPENISLDLHDIIGILLRERLLSDTRFGCAKLLEVSDGAWPASSLPLEQQRAFIDFEAPKVGYFLKLLGEKPGQRDEDSVVEPHIFLHEDLRTQRELDVEEVESIFWAVKNHDSGFLLHHALQLVLDYLPKSATLRIRTSDGYSFTCAPQSFMVAEMDVLPKKTIFINATHPRTVVNNGKKREIHMDQYVFGEHFFAEPWVCLVFLPDEKELGQKPNRDDDKCVMLDINLPVLGARGPGGEPFALERRNVYHNELLPRAGTEEDLDLTQSPRIHATNREKAQPAIDLAKRILGRLERFARKEEFYCSYCGKAAPKVQCSRCHGKSRYCGAACQKKAWPYHKTWCKTDAAAPQEAEKDTDVEMKDRFFFPHVIIAIS
ncbi:hypothetical protein ACEPAF_9593 [Sanghuangporus sanghuang]